MLTYRVIKRVDVEHEPGAWIEVRLPSLHILERAKQAKSKQSISLMSGIDVDFSRLQGFTAADQAERLEYDWLTLLQACILVWSYEEPVTPENVAELDEVTVHAVLAVLLPRETEVTRKNGSG